MLKMSWDSALAALAGELGKRCNFDHGHQYLPDGRYVGQNIFMSTGSFGLTSAMKSWWDEKNHFNVGSMTCAPGAVCGHFTQMAWAKTSTVGCNVTKCSIMSEQSTGDEEMATNANFLVCNYYPGGNMNGENPYKVGAACADCPSDATCSDGLCVTSATVAAPPASAPAPAPATATGSNQNLECSAGCSLCGDMADISKCECSCTSSDNCHCRCPMSSFYQRKMPLEFKSASMKTNRAGCSVEGYSGRKAAEVAGYGERAGHVRRPEAAKKNKGKHGHAHRRYN